MCVCVCVCVCVKAQRAFLAPSSASLPMLTYVQCAIVVVIVAAVVAAAVDLHHLALGLSQFDNDMSTAAT